MNNMNKIPYVAGQFDEEERLAMIEFEKFISMSMYKWKESEIAKTTLINNSEVRVLTVIKTVLYCHEN